MPEKTVRSKILLVLLGKHIFTFLFLCLRGYVNLFFKHWKKCIEKLVIVCNVMPLEMY